MASLGSHRRCLIRLIFSVSFHSCLVSRDDATASLGRGGGAGGVGGVLLGDRGSWAWESLVGLGEPRALARGTQEEEEAL